MAVSVAFSANDAYRERQNTGPLSRDHIQPIRGLGVGCPMPSSRRHPVVLYFRADTSLARRLADAARRDDRPMSSFTRWLIKRGLDQYEQREQRPVRTNDEEVRP